MGRLTMSTRDSVVLVLLGGMAASCGLARPVGAVGSIVPSRYRGQPLTVIGAQPAGGTPAARVSTPSESASASKLGAYLVQPGDTLWSIARRNGTTVDRLYALNSMSSARELRAGQRLHVPRTETVSDAPPATGLTSPAPKESAPDSPPPIVTARPPRTSSVRQGWRWPVEGTLTSRFGRRSGRAHDGIDIGAPAGTAVRAAAAGKVLFAGTHGAYGKLVLVRHSNGLVTVYAHQRDIAVRKGQQVAAGQVVGHVGTTGRATGPHLHFEVRRGVTPENPLRHLPP